MAGSRIATIGAGIGGLTAAALLAKRGYAVTVYEQADIPGGCASTFRRRGFTFEVGATQVAGLEPGGIHDRIFAMLGIDLPEATPCDPGCAVYLPGENEPICLWRDRDRWMEERQRQFQGSEPFWRFLDDLFARSWCFQARDPVLPPRSLWDGLQLLQAVRPDTLATVPYAFSTVGDALRGFGLTGDRRLRAFLDLQLKLYSQVDAEETALLYAATTLAVAQAPLGLFHLKGSMQVLSDRLVEALTRCGGVLKTRHCVEAIEAKQPPQLQIANRRTGETWWEPADAIVANVTVWDLVRLAGEGMPQGYRDRVARLPAGSVAFVVYLGVAESAIPAGCPPHLQLLEDYGGRSLFVSVSQPGDGRAPAGKATIVASTFSDRNLWWSGEADYATLKQTHTEWALTLLKRYFHLDGAIEVLEAATPRTFARYTQRLDGMVGGVGMRVPTFGPFGFANRTPLPNVWLVGDCTHPGEGTAGVSYAALTAVRQIERAV